jgi:ankyrin repeat protein
MHKIYKEYYKVQSESNMDPLDDLLHPPLHQGAKKRDRDLSQAEKKYLLATERGDIVKVKKYLEEESAEDFDKNAVDPLGRNALHIAIEYENLEMMEVLLGHNVESNEAILHAINEEFVEAVELLLVYQDNGNQLTEVCVRVCVLFGNIKLHINSNINSF